ncbi:hypothetical protein ILYODFUR_025356 [Ilyodon furcidens]|uniref:NADH dehydrogenase subunit 6 n=1 Tax=Ilyodon furcidens TaxID=33524 RepID=A0ABV0T2A8_9TELE
MSALAMLSPPSAFSPFIGLSCLIFSLLLPPSLPCLSPLFPMYLYPGFYCLSLDPPVGLSAMYVLSMTLFACLLHASYSAHAPCAMSFIVSYLSSFLLIKHVYSPCSFKAPVCTSILQTLQPYMTKLFYWLQITYCCFYFEASKKLFLSS